MLRLGTEFPIAFFDVIVDELQVLHRHIEIGVGEMLLNRPHVNPALEWVDCMTMPKRVGCHTPSLISRLIDVCLFQRAFWSSVTTKLICELRSRVVFIGVEPIR